MRILSKVGGWASLTLLFTPHAIRAQQIVVDDYTQVQFIGMTFNRISIKVLCPYGSYERFNKELAVLEKDTDDDFAEISDTKYFGINAHLTPTESENLGQAAANYNDQVDNFRASIKICGTEADNTTIEIARKRNYYIDQVVQILKGANATAHMTQWAENVMKISRTFYVLVSFTGSLPSVPSRDLAEVAVDAGSAGEGEAIQRTIGNGGQSTSYSTLEDYMAAHKIPRPAQ